MEGKPLDVDVYSRYDRVRLYLNDKLIEERPTTRAERFVTSFKVPYGPGVLKAVGVQDGKPIAEMALRTVGEAVQIRLTPDRVTLRADGQDLSFITVESVDKAGRPIPGAAHPVIFKLDGPGVIAALGNGDSTSEEMYQGNQRKLFNGKALVVVRASRTAGTIRLVAGAEGLKPATLSLQSRPGPAVPYVS
jgi:beta-galactosidase